MKKTFRLIGMIVAAVLISTGMIACEDDDDDDFNPVGFDYLDSGIVGEWQHSASGNGWSDTETITFYADGTYSETDVETDAKGTENSWEKGKWNTNVTKNQIRLIITDSSDRSEIGDVDVENYSVANGVLTLDGKNYTSVTSD